ncbi:hypothetical protein MnTg02_00272 [bacterium MnTg02]|nr:hypothetical protein MnTg02_00272 [bacterium MnTg02]
MAIAGQFGHVGTAEIHSRTQYEQTQAQKSELPTIPKHQETRAWDQKQPCDNPEKREQADLCQQWRMAKATEELVTLTDRQIRLTNIEIFALIVAICFTAWAAFAAGRAASAAEKTVGVAKETAERELRAYINYKQGAIGRFDSGRPFAEVSFQNYGQTPAYDVVGSVEVKFTEDIHMDSFPEPDQKSRKQFGVLGPTAFYSSVLTLDDPSLTQTQKDMLLNGKAALFVYGSVNYKDVFDRPRTTKFRMIFGGDTEISDDFRFATCNKGNEAT